MPGLIRRRQSQMISEKIDSQPVLDTQEMLDMVFDLNGAAVPEDAPFLLWQEIVRLLPWLKDVENVGILPLRGSVSGNMTLLSKRAKLVLRVPVKYAPDTAVLTGQQLNIGGNALIVGKGKERHLQPVTTLHAFMVESGLGEVEFLADMQSKLQNMNIQCNLICDKQRIINGDVQALKGFGLVLHDLKPQASLTVQCSGLGGARQFGCGIFVPFKAISGLD